jgi:hypothetical protein
LYEFVLYVLRKTATLESSDDNDADANDTKREASDAILGTATLRARSAP